MMNDKICFIMEKNIKLNGASKTSQYFLNNP